jgi:hypothetical protein
MELDDRLHPIDVGLFGTQAVASTAGVIATGPAPAWRAVAADPDWAAGASFQEAATAGTTGIMVLPRRPATLGEVSVGVPLLSEI